MSFCAKCGRRRDGDARYCGGCGAEFDQAADEAEADEAAAPAGLTRTDLPDGAPQADLAADVTRADGAPDPFAAWYQPEAPRMPAGGLRDGAGEQWQPTETVQASPTYPPAQPSGYPPPPAAPAPPFAQYPPGQPAGPPDRGGRGGLFIVVAVVVVLAAGGGAYALASSLGKHPAAQRPAQPSVSAPASTGPAAASTPATSPAAGGTSTPAPAASLVAITPGVSAPSSVETLLGRYFEGINQHDYQEYASTLNPAQRASKSQSASAFSSGYQTTTDSGMTLTSLASTGGGGLTATVTFTSHQAAAQSIDQHSSCNEWTTSFYLVPQGSGYLIGPVPAGYKPIYADC
jgi:hypothetical protein